LIEACELHGLSGIDVSGASQVTIAGNAIDALHIGIQYSDETIGTVEANKIRGQGDGGNTSGIEIGGIAEVETKYNDLRNLENGIMCRGGAQVTLSQNKIVAKNSLLYEQSVMIREAIVDFDQVRKNNDFNGYCGGLHEEGDYLIRSYIFNRLRAFVLATWQFPLVGTMYRWVYVLVSMMFTYLLGRMKGVRSLYLRRGMASGNWIPGSSDIDTLLVVDAVAPENELEMLLQLKAMYRKVKKVFPVIGEMQIVTEKELNNYFTSGDMRAWEAGKNWKLLAGENISRASCYQYQSGKYEADIFTELLHSYKILCNVYFNRESYVNAKPLFVKSFIDILRYISCFEKGPGCDYFDRRKVVEEYVQRCTDAQAREVLSAVQGAWNKNQKMDQASYQKAFLFIVTLFRDFSKDRLPHIACPPTSGIYEKASVPEVFKKIEASRLNDTKQLVNEIRKRSLGDVQGIILDDPGFLYLLIRENAISEEGFIDRMRNAQRYIQNKMSTSKTPFLILTPSMFQLLLFSLHRETPFNYFKYSADKETCIVDDCFEERHQCNIPRDIFTAPGRELMLALIKESVSVASLSLRTSDLTDKYELVYWYNRVLGLDLALSDAVFAEPYVENVLALYGDRHPEAVAWLETFRNDYLNEVSPAETRKNQTDAFRENYLFLKGILDRLNNRIGEERHE
jgi:hypothetical protein